jgi:D-amino-acid dehydrogenase
MRVAVIGAGIVGITSAFELARDGHEVTVFERNGGVASETSFANAGVIAPGYVMPWASPGMAGKVIKHLLSPHSPVRINAVLSPTSLAWLWKWWRASNRKSFELNRSRMQALALFSRDRLHSLSQELRLDFERSTGYLVLLRSGQDVAMAKPGLKVLAELGVKFKGLTADECRAVEPGLSTETKLKGGIHLPDDEVANCREFAHLLRGEAQSLGVTFRFQTQVLRILPGTKPQVVHQHVAPDSASGPERHIESVERDKLATQSLPPPIGPVTEDFDAVLVCAAMGAPALLAPHGLRLPLLPVYGYSVTAPMRRVEAHPDLGPRSGVMDERYKVAITRLGNRLRVAGSAELGGSPERHNQASLATLHKVLHDWFPGVAKLSQAQTWKGARPMLPDGPPVLGPSGIPGVWLNLGHGSSGWALACGSARVLSEMMSGKKPSIAVDGLSLDRLKR